MPQSEQRQVAPRRPSPERIEPRYPPDVSSKDSSVDTRPINPSSQRHVQAVEEDTSLCADASDYFYANDNEWDTMAEISFTDFVREIAEWVPEGILHGDAVWIEDCRKKYGHAMSLYEKALKTNCDPTEGFIAM